MSESPGAQQVRSSLLVGVLAFTGIVGALTQTLVVPLIAQLPAILNTSSSNASWVITVTLLTGAVATPVVGRLGDMYGKRRMLLICTVPLVLGSVLCAMASSLVPMLIGRGLQGLGVGLIPLGISLLRDALPPERLHSSIALMSASMGIGGALGLPIAAAVAQNASWRALFWATGVLSAVVFVLLWRVAPQGRGTGSTARFDVVGALGLGTALTCLLLAISKGGDWGWTSSTTLDLFAAAVVVLLVWGWWELRRSEPLVDLRVAARLPVLLTNCASVVVGFGMYAQSLIVPQLLQLPAETGYGLGQSMLAMGLWMAPGGLMMMLVSPIGGKLSSKRGPKVTLFVGCLIIALGYGSSIVLMGSTWGLLVVTAICSTGVGFAYGAMPALIMSAVPQSETASANSVNSLMRSMGTSISAAVVGVVLSQMSVQAAGYSIPTEAGFRTGLLIGCGVALVAAAITLTIPVVRRKDLHAVDENVPAKV
ncbi:Major Facilitator Superfamily protein [Rhodococcus rhodochrous J3]|uniref:Major Facilitator Superfamily protein n=1 Tax=Rhodococcus rhodochrous J3 TaxID=903528 RepID=A0ABY1M7M5_RHORH|nr:MFS transporter [Rhodococcus rhodochrous]AYA27176.1 MFS transporter [Rhodococcus rhodochrous]MBF4477881.1 MFS transporter [Rhodococcus rhodochrous]MDJ0400696.1 MFS transporter [Rhodococcus rhodochrous]MDO1484089.1 MFS transporter [Rhodococcus rhodochrous]TWH41628.1 Arabinose efflux permease [Rhodococcus rhodochrous J38]